MCIFPPFVLSFSVVFIVFSIVTLFVILSLKCCGSSHVQFPILNIFVFSSFIFASDAFEWRLYVSNIALNSRGVLISMVLLSA